MSSNKHPEFTAEDMMALRGQPEALKIATDKLQVRDMGPADHIRTKHEVKAFLEANGTRTEAEAIVTRARLRREMWQTQSVTQNLTQRQQRTQRIDE